MRGCSAGLCPAGVAAAVSASRITSRAFRAPSGRESLSCSCKKVTKEHAPVRSPSGVARRFPALLASSGDGAELAALKHPRLFAPDAAAMLGSLQGGGKSRSRSPATATATATTTATATATASNRRSALLLQFLATPSGVGPTRDWTHFVSASRCPSVARTYAFPCVPAMCEGLAWVGWWDCRKHGSGVYAGRVGQDAQPRPCRMRRKAHASKFSPSPHG